MRRRLAIFSVISACLLASVFGGSAGLADTPRQITVTGEGRVAAAPDMAVVTLGQSMRGEDAGLMMEDLNVSTAAILATLERFGVTGADMQTSNLSLQPIYDTRSSGLGEVAPKGYEASNMVTVRVRDLDQLGAILSAVLSDGANSLSGLRFDVSDPAPLLSEARKAAVADALAKAQELAGAAGVSLGPVQSISEGGGFRPQPEMMVTARMADVAIATGEVGLSAAVTVVIALTE